MKPYYKRLLIVSVAATLLLALTGVFIRDTFQVTAGQLKLSAAVDSEAARALKRSDATLDLRAVDADGYDVLLAKGFSAVLRNDRAELYFHEQTAEIALKDSKTGQIWYSNPQDRDEETMVEGATRKRLGAQLSVSYYDAKGTYCQMDSYNECIANKTMSYSLADDRLVVKYDLGKTAVTLADVPQQISVARMDAFAKKLTEKERKELLGYYRVASVAGKDAAYAEKLIQQYPHAAKEDVYYLTKDSNRILKKIRGYLDAAGYTWDDLDYDNRENQVETEAADRAFFHFEIVYSLDGAKLIATLRGESMAYAEKFPPYEVRLLEYFGCGGKTERGYFLLPDGSGSLMLWNNGKIAETPFSMRIYGDDTVMDTESQYVQDQKASLPVFGIKNGRAALLAEVRKGEALCTLCARVAGSQNSYNAAYVSILTTCNDTMEISSDSKQIYFEETPYRGDVTVSYMLLDEADADYMGMARTYRQELLSRGALRQNAAGGYPLSLEIICAVPAKKTVLGVSVDGMEVMTDYGQIGRIAEIFSDADALWLSPAGMLAGGLRQTWLQKIALERALGDRVDFEKTAEKLRADGRILMPQLWLQTAFTASGLNASSYCVRDLCRDIAVRYYYNYISRYQNQDGRVIYQLNQKGLDASVNAAGQFARANALGGVCVNDTGSMLWSDFKRKESVNRVEMQSVQAAALETLADDVALYLSNPNQYALGYSAGIVNMPCADSAFRVTDDSVPFYQAVIRGSIPYCCPSLNYEEDYTLALLRAVEFGAGLQYTVSARTTALLKETDYAYVNCGNVADWQAIIGRDYQRARAVLAALDGVEMTGHRQVAMNVYETKYADGTRVYVNYNEAPYDCGGVSVPGRDFIAVKGGDGQ